MEERKQSREEIIKILEEAFEKKCPVNLVIRNSKGEPKFTPDLLVMDIEEEEKESYIYLTTLDENGNSEEVASLELSRIISTEIEIESFD